MNQSPDLPSESSLPPKLPPSKPAHAAGRFRFSKVFARWWWLATIFIAAITYTVTMIPTWMEMDGPLYESSALIEVKPIVDVDPTLSSRGGMGTTITRQFMNTQFEIIEASVTLEMALEKNDLLKRLGGDKKEAIKRMQKSITTTQRRGTDLIEISYRDADAQLARDGASAVYEAFKDRRYELALNMRKDQLKAMKMELQNKTDRVQEHRKRLMDIAEKAGLIWVEEEGGGKLKANRSGSAQAEKELYEAKGEMRKLTFQLNKLLSAEDEEFLLLTLEMPNADFKEAYKKYEEAIKEIETMKASGLAEGHPDIQTRRARVLEIKKSMDKRAVNVRESIKHKLALVQGRVKRLRGVVNDFQDQGTIPNRTFGEFNAARKEYEMALGIRDKIALRYDIENTKLCIPTNNTIVHQLPEQAGTPATRGREFFVTLGTVFSLPFSVGLGILLMYIAELIIPRRG